MGGTKVRKRERRKIESKTMSKRLKKKTKKYGYKLIKVKMNK